MKSGVNESPEKSIPGTKEDYDKVKKGNYHEYDNSHHSHLSVAFSVRRRRRLLVEKATVVAELLFLTS